MLDTNTASHVIKGDIPVVRHFLIRVETFPGNQARAAHSRSINAILVTRDRAFSRIPDDLTIENWIDDNA